MLHGVQRNRTKDSGKSDDSALGRTDGEDPRNRRNRFYLYRKDPAVCIGAVSSQCTVFVCAGLDYNRGDPEDLLPAPEGNLGEDQPHADEVF